MACFCSYGCSYGGRGTFCCGIIWLWRGSYGRWCVSECVTISQSTKRHSEGTYPSLNIDRSTALKTSQHIEEPNISINKQLLINISRTFLWTTAVYPSSPSSHRTSIKGSRSRAIKQALITMKSNQKAITRLEKIIKFSLLTTRSTCKWSRRERRHFRESMSTVWEQNWISVKNAALSAWISIKKKVSHQ